MITKDLIARLEKMPQDAEIFIDKDTLIIPYQGNHERVGDIYPMPDGKGIVLMGEG